MATTLEAATRNEATHFKSVRDDPAKLRRACAELAFPKAMTTSGAVPYYKRRAARPTNHPMSGVRVIRQRDLPKSLVENSDLWASLLRLPIGPSFRVHSFKALQTSNEPLFRALVSAICVLCDSVARRWIADVVHKTDGFFGRKKGAPSTRLPPYLENDMMDWEVVVNEDGKQLWLPQVPRAVLHGRVAPADARLVRAPFQPRVDVEKLKLLNDEGRRITHIANVILDTELSQNDKALKPNQKHLLWAHVYDPVIKHVNNGELPSNIRMNSEANLSALIRNATGRPDTGSYVVIEALVHSIEAFEKYGAAPTDLANMWASIEKEWHNTGSFDHRNAQYYDRFTAAKESVPSPPQVTINIQAGTSVTVNVQAPEPANEDLADIDDSAPAREEEQHGRDEEVPMEPDAPEPAPEPAPEAASEAAPEPEPEVAPEAEPEAASEAAPEPEPEAEPEAAPEPEPEPEPEPAPEPATPAPAPAPEEELVTPNQPIPPPRVPRAPRRARALCDRLSSVSSLPVLGGGQTSAPSPPGQTRRKRPAPEPSPPARKRSAPEPSPPEPSSEDIRYAQWRIGALHLETIGAEELVKLFNETLEWGKKPENKVLGADRIYLELGGFTFFVRPRHRGGTTYCDAHLKVGDARKRKSTLSVVEQSFIDQSIPIKAMRSTAEIRRLIGDKRIRIA